MTNTCTTEIVVECFPNSSQTIVSESRRVHCRFEIIENQTETRSDICRFPFGIYFDKLCKRYDSCEIRYDTSVFHSIVFLHSELIVHLKRFNCTVYAAVNTVLYRRLQLKYPSLSRRQVSRRMFFALKNVDFLFLRQNLFCTISRRRVALHSWKKR